MNWGRGIVLSLAAFIVFIGVLAYRMITSETQLVAEDYYKQEIEYQSVIDGKKNLAALGEIPVLKLTKDSLFYQLPEKAALSIEGKVNILRPSESKMDIELSIKETKATVVHKPLNSGRYNIKIAWESDGKLYFYEKAVVI